MNNRRQRNDQELPTRYYSKKQERGVAKTLNGTRTLNSGATMFQKGDVLLDSFLIECKTHTTHRDSITIKKDWLEKIKKEALFSGKPNEALIFNFGPGESNYVIISEELFKQFTGEKESNG